VPVGIPHATISLTALRRTAIAAQGYASRPRRGTRRRAVRRVYSYRKAAMGSSRAARRAG
jgi:hypothetical protein